MVGTGHPKQTVGGQGYYFVIDGGKRRPRGVGALRASIGDRPADSRFADRRGARLESLLPDRSLAPAGRGRA
jgi:hypothetical protein